MFAAMNELARRPWPHMTADEFLLWPGDGTHRRFHLFDGEVRAMSPASAAHGVIQANLTILIGMALKLRTSLRVVTEGAVVPALNASDNVRVPDLLVMEGHAERGVVAVSAPVLIAEILSPGNAPTTRENVRAYATLASVREIVVVSTARMEVEVHRRDESGAWLPDAEAVKAGGRVRLTVVGLDCAIEEAYAGTWLAGSHA